MLRRGRASDFAYGAPVREQSETGQASSALSRFRDLLPLRHGRPARHLASGFMAPEWLEHAGWYKAPQGDSARQGCPATADRCTMAIAPRAPSTGCRVRGAEHRARPLPNAGLAALRRGLNLAD